MTTPDTVAATTVVDIDELERVLELLILNPDMRHAFGRAGRLRVQEHFSWKTIIRRYESLWEWQVAEASACVDVEPVLDLRRYNYVDIFRDHPTSLLTEESVVEISDTGRACLNGNLAILQLSLRSAPFTSEQRLLQVLTEVGQRGATCIAVLKKRWAPPTSGDCDRLVSDVARLLKYGLLQVARQPLP